MITIDRKDNCCRTCGAILQVEDAEEHVLHVCCTRCGDEYSLDATNLRRGARYLRNAHKDLCAMPVCPYESWLGAWNELLAGSGDKVSPPARRLVFT